MNEQLGFALRQDRCMGCKACQIACKDKNDLNVGQLWRRVTEFSGGNYEGDDQDAPLKNDVYAFWISLGCNHCSNPICVENCPTKAMYKRAEDGLVLHDDKKCIGCQMCVWSCPYGAPHYNPVTRIVGKCNYCLDLVQQGKDPACVGACPLRALDSGNLKELEGKYGKGETPSWLVSPSLTNPSLVVTPHKSAVKK